MVESNEIEGRSLFRIDLNGKCGKNTSYNEAICSPPFTKDPSRKRHAFLSSLSPSESRVQVVQVRARVRPTRRETKREKENEKETEKLPEDRDKRYVFFHRGTER